MPLSVKKVGDKYRLVEPDGKIAKTKKGNAVDGGGSSDKSKAVKQVQAIEINKKAKFK